jgi:hypothetical protein
MTIYRPDWKRKMGMTNWARGDKDVLIRFVDPVEHIRAKTWLNL